MKFAIIYQLMMKVYSSPAQCVICQQYCMEANEQFARERKQEETFLSTIYPFNEGEDEKVAWKWSNTTRTSLNNWPTDEMDISVKCWRQWNTLNQGGGQRRAAKMKDVDEFRRIVMDAQQINLIDSFPAINARNRPC